MKICLTCGEQKPLDEFHAGRTSSRPGILRHHAHCKECMRLRLICRQRGITVGQYWQMWVEQDGRCAICRCSESAVQNGLTRNLSVDHNHHTGHIRGLLCTSCNTGLGCMNDDTDLAYSMIAYLMGDLFRFEQLGWEAYLEALALTADSDTR